MKKIEILDKRKKREKHYLQEDGTFIAELYDEDIHFFKNGKYEEINNTLVLKDDFYQNESNDFKIYFSKKVDSEIMRIEQNGHYINISLDCYQDYTIEKAKNSSKYYDRIKFSDILKNIDLSYDIMPSKIKENIILKNKDCNIEDLIFNIDTDLDIIKENNKIVAKNKEKVMFFFEKTYMIDSKDSKSNDIDCSITREGNSYKLKFINKSDWLLDESRYPIIIDPTITQYSNDNSVIDTYIYEGDTGIIKSNQDSFKVGVEKINNTDIKNRALLWFELPELSTGSQVISAKLSLFGYPNTSNTYDYDFIDIHRVTEPWKSFEPTWNNFYDKYDSRVEGNMVARRHYYIDGNSINYNVCMSDITSLVQKWYTNIENNGIMLKLTNELYNPKILPMFFSKENNIVGYNPKPLLTITYQNKTGLEDCMQYEIQNFESATTYCNTFNGNIIHIIDMPNIRTGNMPVCLNATYNTNDAVLEKNYGLGLGFKLNLYQTIREVIIDNKTHLEYLDEDGTLHYFYNKKTKINNGSQVSTIYENTFFDEDGLNLEIERTSSNYILKNNDNNEVYTFTIISSIGYLTKITNEDGFENNIYYDKYNRINSIVDANNQTINIIYSSDNTLIKMTNTSYVKFSLYNGCVSSIEFRNGDSTEAISYLYNSNNLINQITDIKGKCIQYEYYSQKPYRLKRIKEYSNNNYGRVYTYNYGYNVTAISDGTNYKTISFSESGIPESITLNNDSNLDKAYGIKLEYGDSIKESDFEKNKLLSNICPIKYTNNIIKNPDFENSDIYFLTERNSQLFVSDDCSYTGLKSLKFVSNSGNDNCRINKIINVKKGKDYTFSAYIKNDLYFTPVHIVIGYFDNNDNFVSNNSESIISSDKFNRLEVSIKIPESNFSNDLLLGVVLEGTGVCYIDALQLEEGIIANKFNLIENSDFSLGYSDWELVSQTQPLSNIFETKIINNISMMKVNMISSNSSSISKVMNISGKVGEHFTLSFWYKNKGLNNAKDAFDIGTKCNVNLIFNPVDQMIVGDSLIKDFALNPNETEWQFFCYDFIAPYDFTSFKINFYQDQNANEFYFTYISLYKDVPSVSFSYAENGRVKKKKKMNNTIEEFNYDKDNKMINLIDANGNISLFEYERGTNRILRGISSSGLSNDLVYDSNKKVISTVIKNRGISHEIKENEIYKIRLSGTSNYFSLINYKVELLNDNNNCLWIFEKENINEIDYYRIKNNIINNKCLNANNHSLYLGEYNTDSSLFKLIKKDNGCFVITNKSTNKSIRYDENNNELILNDYVEEDSSFEFFLEKNINSQNYFIEKNINYCLNNMNVESIIDTNLNNINYLTDEYTGIIKKIYDNKREVNYEYDDFNRIEKILSGNRFCNYSYNNKKLLDRLTQNDRFYSFEYDDFNNIKSINVNGIYNLITNIYGSNNGNLIRKVYGNGDYIDYEYDDFNRLAKIITEDDVYNFIYNNNSELAMIESDFKKVKYLYDTSNRVYEVKDNDYKINYEYNNNDSIVQRNVKYNNKSFLQKNIINEEELLKTITIDNNSFNYEYDSIGRIKKYSINNTFETEYSYLDNGNRASLFIKEINNNGNTIRYKYNKKGNITHIYENDSLMKKYYYDEENELIREDDFLNNTTIRYKYDLQGNIINKKEYRLNTFDFISQIKYLYNSNWKDQLVKVQGLDITYDVIGNPTNIGTNISLEWKNGRQLKKYFDSINSNVIEFNYNANGERTSKKVNNVETLYYYDNDKIIIEKKDNNVLYYLYDDMDNLVALKYNNDWYYYIKNIHNDIIGIIDENGNIVANYSYDSWGKIISITDNLGIDVSACVNHIANINPFRYRSYYYDSELNLYYLKNRFYNPEWGRFINSDNYLSTDCGILGYNMYAYCNNNPISFTDVDGNAIVVGLVVGLALVGAALIVNTAIQYKKAKNQVQKNQKKKNVPDATDRINKELEKNATIIKNSTYINIPPKVKLDNFINQVKENGPMDLKNNPEWNGKTFSYNGIVMEDQDIGNFNFGYIGRAYGYSESFLTAGAGVYQLKSHWKNKETYKNCFTPSLCDDPRDNYFIKMGVKKYDEDNQK